MDPLLQALLALMAATLFASAAVRAARRDAATAAPRPSATGDQPDARTSGAEPAGSRSEAAALLLDTSALIDGRVVDLVELSRDPRPIVVPAEVIEELEHLSGSASPGRRRRGLLGQENLRVLAERAGTVVEPVAGLAPRSERAHGLHLPGGVDEALLARCRRRPWEVLVTLDGDLARRAGEAELVVLDLARLAERLSQRHRVGDVLQVLVAAEGRRADQGTATLDDGTRVMIDGAAGRLGETITVTVDSISRTRGGRVLFARPTGSDEAGESAMGESAMDEPATRVGEE